MIEKSMAVGLENGSEARPIAVLVQMASKYESTVYIVSGNKKVNAKSIMGMMGIGLKNGETITIVTEGRDEIEAAEDIERYLKAGAV